MEYNTIQRQLRACELRFQGLTNALSRGESVNSEHARISEARTEIRGRMTSAEIAAYEAHENRVLTTAQIAEEAKQQIKAMNENRDKPSI